MRFHFIDEHRDIFPVRVMCEVLEVPPVHGERHRQFWVAGGAGITAFIARLQAMAEVPTAEPVDPIDSTASPDSGFIERIRSLTGRAGVRFHLLKSGKDGYLTLERLAA